MWLARDGERWYCEDVSKTDRTVKSEIEATSALDGESGGNGLEPLQPRKGPVPALAELELSSPSNCLSGAVPITAVARFPEIFAVGDGRQYRVRIRKAVVMIECEGVKIGGDSISEILIDPDQFSLAVSEKNESNHSLGGEFTISGKSPSDIVQINGKGEARKK